MVVGDKEVVGETHATFVKLSRNFRPLKYYRKCDYKRGIRDYESTK